MITGEWLRKKYRFTLIVEGLVAIIILYFIIFFQPSYYVKSKNVSENFQRPMVTGNTTRVYGKDFYETAVAISQISYPAIFKDDKPNAVILVRGDRKEEAILASRIINYPINAPILYVEKDNVPQVTLNEIKRLDPQGIFVDRNRKAILIGDIGEKVKSQLNKGNIAFRHLQGKDLFELGKKIDDYLSAVKGDHKDAVIVAPIEIPNYALVQSAWTAHADDGFLFVSRNEIPKSTKDALNLRHGGAYIYLLGGENSISSDVKKQLLQYGVVQKIPGGEDIYSQSVGFAGYKDVGKNFGWWLSKRPRDFGWGISEAGHNFIFANPGEWQSAIAASALSHKGKYGPMILVEKDNIADSVRRYLLTVKPMENYAQGQIYNHGWIIGSEDNISSKVQVKLDEILDSRKE
ncbi:cell wall-binding repeat-containing protein [Clostridium sp. JNZ J1-5]|nr:cell wall-binding repeat-containing protein [Clostridium sp.]